ncbi:MAG: serine/threonine protein kinase [Polyangiaceae bacterium]|nr:serine/threonine protein kinase [Polyangiaceae bacterium]
MVSSLQAELPCAFGRLILLRKLAQGGMGEVYLAATRGIEGAERPCVVKTIRPEHEEDKSFRARFLDETRVQAQLQHPGVAQILEANTTANDRPYAVVEYIEGRHLGELLSRAQQVGLPLSWADALAVGISFADALAHVHERKDAHGQALEIAHRDLSPQNVMVGYGGDVKVIDFGTARGENRRCRTVSGVVYAKPGYVAPEVARQIPGGPQADLYALGVILWELIAGRRFLQGDAVEHQASVAAGTKSLPAIADSLGAPADLDLVLKKLTTTSLVERYQSARDATSEMVAILKLAPSLANGERSVRGRISHMMQKLYPAEPARSRADFSRRVAHARNYLKEGTSAQALPFRPEIPEPSPATPELEEEFDSLLPGTRYRLEEELSSSPMGEVWRARHLDLGREVAVKLIPEKKSRSTSMRRQFRAEARALANLKHPGLVHIFDFGVSANGRCFYAMELLRGETLEARIARGPLEPKEAVSYLEKVARALDSAHRAGVIHRDITPSNIFLTQSGDVKLLDFGVAQIGQQSSPEGEDAPLVVGTPEYISPEQASGAVADARSDFYSLGGVLYEALTGRLPHVLGPEGSPTLAALLTAKITVVPPKPSSFNEGISRRLEKLVMSLLDREPAHRPSSAERLADELLLCQLDPAKKPVSKVFLWKSAVAASFFLVMGTVALLNRWSESSAKESSALSVLVQQAELRKQVEPSAEEKVLSQAIALESMAQEEHVVPSPRELVSEKDMPIAQASTSSASSPARVQPSVNKGLEKEVTAALRLQSDNQAIKAHHQMKLLAHKHPESVPVHAALIKTARGVKAWGEALTAAKSVVVRRGSADDYIELAKLEAATLQGDPVASLKRAVELEPDNQRAKIILQAYLEKRVARR